MVIFIHQFEINSITFAKESSPNLAILVHYELFMMIIFLPQSLHESAIFAIRSDGQCQYEFAIDPLVVI